jgi:hypothetical protein
MKFFKKGVLGKVSILSVFLFFLFFALVLINMSVANPLISSYDRYFICEGCEVLDIPSDTDVDVFLNVSAVRFKDESEEITLVDIMPSGWDIVDSNGGEVVDSEFYKTINWVVDLTETSKLYESESYDILEINMLYTVKSPAVSKNISFMFTTRTDEEVGTTRINVYPLGNVIRNPEEESQTNEIDLPSSREEIIKPFSLGNKYLKRLRIKPDIYIPTYQKVLQRIIII